MEDVTDQGAPGTPAHLNVVQPEEVEDARAAGLVVSASEAPRLYVRAEGQDMNVGALPCILVTQEGEYVLIRRLPHGEACVHALVALRARLQGECLEQLALERTQSAALRARAEGAEADLDALHLELGKARLLNSELSEEVKSLKEKSLRTYLADALTDLAKRLDPPAGRGG
jgi:hypothetical protein